MTGAPTERGAAGPALGEDVARAFLEHAPDAMMIVGVGGRMVLVNAQVERLFGYPRNELLGEPVEMLLPERLRQIHNGHREQYAANPQVRTMGAGLELFGRRRDGSEFPVDVSLSPLDPGPPPLVAAAIRDVTDRRRAQKELEAANRELEAFSYSVSHDLRAPLRSIQGFTAILLEDHASGFEPEARRLFDRVSAAATRGGALIDDLLDLSRMSRAELREEAVDLGAIAGEIARGLVAEAPDRRVVFRIAPNALGRGDRRLLGVALENLLSNAWKFTAEQPEPLIEFGVASHDGGAAYFIRDNGAGFDMAYADKLFTPFQRLHGRQEFEGNGIGLATVERIVRRHGGEVWAEGAVGRGATFTFTLGDTGDAA